MTLPHVVSSVPPAAADPASPHIWMSLVLLLICAAGAWAMQRKPGDDRTGKQSGRNQ